ncbi:MAG: hypothetical protein GY753_04550, partial [Gammaproteobacteria bacterium]|nr:hypothetical protein [Gammaproteobacteria bacterium]
MASGRNGFCIIAGASVISMLLAVPVHSADTEPVVDESETLIIEDGETAVSEGGVEELVIEEESGQGELVIEEGVETDELIIEDDGGDTIVIDEGG